MNELDYFAGMYLNGLVSGVWANPSESGFTPSETAKYAYDYAAALLKERFKRDQNGDRYPEYREQGSE